MGQCITGERLHCITLSDALRVQSYMMVYNIGSLNKALFNETDYGNYKVNVPFG